MSLQIKALEQTSVQDAISSKNVDTSHMGDSAKGETKNNGDSNSVLFAISLTSEA